MFWLSSEHWSSFVEIKLSTDKPTWKKENRISAEIFSITFFIILSDRISQTHFLMIEIISFKSMFYLSRNKYKFSVNHKEACTSAVLFQLREFSINSCRVNKECYDFSKINIIS